MLSNPGCCPGLGNSALSGRLGKSLREIMASRRICNPPSKNVRPIKTGGFVIPQQKEKHTPLLRISNPQSLKRLGHFLAPDFKSGGTPASCIQSFCPYRATFLLMRNPGCYPGLGASALSGRMEINYTYHPRRMDVIQRLIPSAIPQSGR